MSAVPVVEPCVCPDVFVTGAGPLQFMGDNIRLTLLVTQRCSYDGSPENAVVARLVGSRFDMLQIAAAIVRDCNTDSTPDKLTDAFTQFQEGPKGRH